MRLTRKAVDMIRMRKCPNLFLPKKKKKKSAILKTTESQKFGSQLKKLEEPRSKIAWANRRSHGGTSARTGRSVRSRFVSIGAFELTHKKNENFGKQKLKKMRGEWLYLGMGLGFWGEGLRGTKYLSMEMSLEQFFGFGILEKSKSKVKKATTRSFPANYFCRARNCGWAGPGCQYLVGLGRVKPDPTSVKLCFCFFFLFLK